MAWLDTLTGQLIALDTAPLIYFLEEHPTYLPLVAPFFEKLDAGDIQVVSHSRSNKTILVG